jgi:CBS domain-containing protein
MMNELKFPHLPVVKDGQYEGMLTEDDLLDAKGPDLIETLRYDLLPFSVNGQDHFLSAVRIATEQRLKIVPVTGADKEYLGSLVEEDLLRQFAILNGVAQKGALIVLSMEADEFSTGQLSKLVETNDAAISQLNTFNDETTGKLVVTLRVSKEEVSDIIATFQRYDYQVIFHAGQEQYENELRRNYLHLMNFLQM